MLELLALALLQFSTIFSSPTQSTLNAGGSSGWGDGNTITTQNAGGSSGWGDGNATVQSAGGSSGWGDGNK